jgi:hypothetical protein
VSLSTWRVLGATRFIKTAEEVNVKMGVCHQQAPQEPKVMGLVVVVVVVIVIVIVPSSIR